MRFKPISTTFIALTISTLLVECNNITRDDVKFDKAQWDLIGDFHSFPNRESMLEDITEYHQIKGLTYHQLIDSLGEPANYGDTKDRIYYDIVVNYGYLDPKSGKYLAIGFNKDSIAIGFKWWSGRIDMQMNSQP